MISTRPYLRLPTHAQEIGTTNLTPDSGASFHANARLRGPEAVSVIRSHASAQKTGAGIWRWIYGADFWSWFLQHVSGPLDLSTCTSTSRLICRLFKAYFVFILATESGSPPWGLIHWRTWGERVNQQFVNNLEIWKIVVLSASG